MSYFPAATVTQIEEPHRPDALRLVYFSFQCYLFLSILYYFLRFQFGLVWFIPLAQYSFAVYILGVLFLGLLFKRIKIAWIEIDLAILLFFSYNVVLLIYSLPRGGPMAVAQDVKDYIIPMSMYFGAVAFLDREQSEKLVKLLAYIALIVALIYIAEFINKMVLGNGYFKYTDAMDAYTKERGSRGGVSKSYYQGDLYDLVRMAGPLSHNNSTGYMLALGAIIFSVYWVFRRKMFAKRSGLAICLFALLLTGARTSMLAGAAGVGLVLLFGLYYRYISIWVIPLSIPVLVGLFLGVINLGVIDMSAMGMVFSPEELYRTLGLMFSYERFADFLDRARSPVVFIGGLGFPFATSNDPYSPALNDDVFFTQLLSMYGVLFSLIFLMALGLGLFFSVKRLRSQGALIHRESRHIVFICLASILSAFVSIGHTNAVSKPQISPALVMILASFSITCRDSKTFWLGFVKRLNQRPGALKPRPDVTAV